MYRATVKIIKKGRALKHINYQSIGQYFAQDGILPILYLSWELLLILLRASFISKSLCSFSELVHAISHFNGGTIDEEAIIKVSVMIVIASMLWIVIASKFTFPDNFTIDPLMNDPFKSPAWYLLIYFGISKLSNLRDEIRNCNELSNGMKHDILCLLYCCKGAISACHEKFFR